MGLFGKEEPEEVEVLGRPAAVPGVQYDEVLHAPGHPARRGRIALQPRMDVAKLQLHDLRQLRLRPLVLPGKLIFGAAEARQVPGPRLRQRLREVSPKRSARRRIGRRVCVTEAGLDAGTHAGPVARQPTFLKRAAAWLRVRALHKKRAPAVRHPRARLPIPRVRIMMRAAEARQVPGAMRPARCAASPKPWRRRGSSEKRAAGVPIGGGADSPLSCGMPIRPTDPLPASEEPGPKPPS